MARFISVGGDCYGVWSNADGTVIGDGVPAAKKTAEINTKIANLQKAHQAQAKRR
jgi:hypothetical protein